MNCFQDPARKLRQPVIPTVIMMCGLTGAGKTTLSRKLEEERGAVLLSPDSWMIDLFGYHMPRELFDARLATVKELIWTVAARLLALRIDVVLDFRFWKREERREFARRARAVGATPLLYYLDVPVPVLERRLRLRNTELPEGTFKVTPEMLELFTQWFEIPSEVEGLDIIRVSPEH